MSNRSIEDVAHELHACASSWETDVCLLGNVRAREVVALVEAYLATLKGTP